MEELVVSCLGILISAIGIIVAIRVPLKIAEKQDKIALFEKRYSIYNELKTIDDFLNDYYETLSRVIDSLPVENLDERAKDQLEASHYESLWETYIHQNEYPSIENTYTILKLQAQTIDSLDIMFSDITSEEIELCKNFYNTYRAMTDRYVVVTNADGFVIFGEFDDNYERFELKNLLEKLKSQLYL